jgi:peptide/nickel transport system ATP-binding protein
MPVLEVKDLETVFVTGAGLVEAVSGISFNLDKEESVGLAGESGCGKSTTAMSIMKLIRPPGQIVKGQILLDGDDLVPKSEGEMRHVRGKRISMVFQGVSNALNPVFRLGDQLTEAVLNHEAVSKEKALARAREILDLVGIDPSRISNYPHEFSGGMKQRIMIATALISNPQVVIADEPTTALDVISQGQVLKLIDDLQRRLGLSLLLITHDLSVIAEVCDKLAIMYAGKIVEYGSVSSLLSSPLHPYAEALVHAFPPLRGAKQRLESIPGSPPILIHPPTGCRFHPRCPYAMEICRREVPKLLEIERGRRVACYLHTEVRT